jgi:hypothetical protein
MQNRAISFDRLRWVASPPNPLPRLATDMGHWGLSGKLRAVVMTTHADIFCRSRKSTRLSHVVIRRSEEAMNTISYDGSRVIRKRFTTNPPKFLLFRILICEYNKFERIGGASQPTIRVATIIRLWLESKGWFLDPFPVL